MSQAINPDLAFVDNSTGQAVALGTSYWGVPYQDPETDPKAPYSDLALTTAVSATQSLTSAGKPEQSLYLSGAYSLRVRDAAGNIVIDEAYVVGLGGSASHELIPSVADLYGNDWSHLSYATTLAFAAGGSKGRAEWYKGTSGGTQTTSGTEAAHLALGYVVDAGGNYFHISLDQPLSVYKYGATVDGSTDDAAPISGNISHVGTATLATGSHKHTGLTLLEGQGIAGKLAAIPSTGKGSILKYDESTGNSITLDGAWTGFDSRRFNQLKSFSINITGTPNASIYADFMTIFQINDVICYGSPSYHLYMRNSYKGHIYGGRFSGATVANLLMTIDAADDVFSGQALIEDWDFWSASNGTNDAAGTIIEAPANIMEQVQFTKCHWKSNDIGMWIKSGSGVVLSSPHFEENTENDIVVESGARNPIIVGGICNNATTTTSCFSLDGYGGSIDGTRFIQATNSAYCIDAGTNSDGLTIKDVQLRRNSGNTMSGIRVQGANTTIRGVRAETGGSAASWPVIVLESTATTVRISDLRTENFSGSGAVVDNGATNVIFEDAEIIESPVFDISASADESGWYLNKEGYVNRAWIVYPGGTGAGTTVSLQIGRSTSAGSTDYTRYADHTSQVSAGVYAKQVVTLTSTPFIDETDVLIFRCSGGSSTAGTAKIIVEITPYRALS